jgi:hypothetical protein
MWAAPEFSALDAEWSTCMVAKGFTVPDNPFALSGQFSSEFWVLQGFTNLPDGSFASLEGGPQQPDPQLHANLIDREIAAAIASYDCRAQVDYEARRWQLTVDMQQEFVDRNQTQLEQWAYQVAHRNASPQG